MHFLNSCGFVLHAIFLFRVCRPLFNPHSQVNMGPTCADRRPARMPLFATRCVRAGDELFVSYGDAWWTAFPTAQSWAEAEARAAELGH